MAKPEEKPTKWLDEPDLGIFSVSRNLPERRYSGDPADLSDDEARQCGFGPRPHRSTTEQTVELLRLLQKSRP